MEAITASTPHPTHPSYASRSSPMHCRSRDGAITRRQQRLVCSLHFKTHAAELCQCRYIVWSTGRRDRVCTGHGISLLSSEQQFSKRMIIKAESRPKAGSSIFLSITVTPVYFDNKVLIEIAATTFTLPSGWKKISSGSSNGSVSSTKNSIGTLRVPNTFFSHFSFLNGKNCHNTASIF